MSNKLWIDKTLSKLFPQCEHSAWEKYVSKVGGQRQYDISLEKALKANTYDNLDDDTKQYIANCQESNKIAQKKGYDIRNLTDEQIKEISYEIIDGLPDETTDEERSMLKKGEDEFDEQKAEEELKKAQEEMKNLDWTSIAKSIK